MKKADEGIVDLEWQEVYALFYPKIYKHEYRRNLELELQIELEESVRRNQDNPDVCGYHQENVGWMGDGFHDNSMKDLRRNYANSKWPKPLQGY
jgi:hypothetical protein